MNKEELWRTHKYEVLAKDEKAYREIQQLIQESSFEVVNQSIQKAIQIKPTIGSVTNSYEHMEATEKLTFFQLVSELMLKRSPFVQF